LVRNVVAPVMIPTWFLLGASLVFVLHAPQAALTGRVTDAETGEPVAGALVTLSDINYVTLSDANGRYRFIGVPAGPQHLSIRHVGFAARTLHLLAPGEGELEVNIALRRLLVTLARVDVRPRLALRGTDNAATLGSDRTASIAAVRNHPLLAEPDALLALSGGDVLTRPESPSGVHIRGGASGETAYLLDGIPVLSPYHTALTFSALNADALERVSVSSVSPSAWFPDALSGTIHATTRASGPLVQAHGGVSSTHARLTLDGPLWRSGATMLFSVRAAFPGAMDQPDEPSYLKGKSGDLIATLRSRVFDGDLQLVMYDATNRFRTAAVAGVTEPPPDGLPHNDFGWRSRSAGAVWSAEHGRMAIRAQAWRATSSADVLWYGNDGVVRELISSRRDDGVLAEVRHAGARATTTAGGWLQRSRADYHADSSVTSPEPGTPPSEGAFALASRTPLAAVFLGHERRVSGDFDAGIGLVALQAAGVRYLNPRALLRWQPSSAAAATLSVARTRQFAQSLRNSESATSTIFPPEITVGTGAPGFPTARSDQGALAATMLPATAVRIGGQLFVRRFHGLALVAPRTGEPFATNGFATGSGEARGISLDLTVTRERYGIIASYGWQRVRLTRDDTEYVPEYGVGQSAETGVIFFPSPTLSLRVGVTAAAGRRASAVSGPLEWEACNVLDRGCEFGGSPSYEPDALGATKLPVYARADVGIRKHWHVDIAGRDAQIAVYGTVSNVFGQRNVLTVTRDPVSNGPARVHMRPLAPLLIGLDWRY
jgi:hypothetical protein